VSRTRIKVCGITQRSDAQAAVAAGVDALGLVFYAGSARAVSIGQAQEVASGVPPLVTLVALFVDAEEALVREVCEQLPIGLLQFHGAETDRWCGQFGKPWMKAIRVAADTDVQGTMRQWPGADAILLDTYRKGSPGGTGERFDWDLVPLNPGAPLVLAGGLNEGNVSAAIRQCKPFAVDVSGGVESAPGIKDHRKIEQFIAAVKAADVSRLEKNHEHF
jgi:phosphoribosylanthranilate isomerase